MKYIFYFSRDISYFLRLSLIDIFYRNTKKKPPAGGFFIKESLKHYEPKSFNVTSVIGNCAHLKLTEHSKHMNISVYKTSKRKIGVLRTVIYEKKDL